MDERYKTGKMSELDIACNLARTWLPPITSQDKITIMNILTGTERTIGAPLLRKYIELLRPYTEVLGLSDSNTVKSTPKSTPREADCVASGIVFFYACLFYIMHFPNGCSHIEDIFLYNLLYILVDHYIDDIRVQPESKDKTIAQMFILINDPLSYKTMELIDPILTIIALIYHRLITRCPEAKAAILMLFKAEVEGLKIQSNPNLSREQYYDIAVRKGGYTMVVLQRIVGNNDPSLDKAAYEIGSVIQLLDDSLDKLSDGKNGIHTIATHDFTNEGNLDNLWIDIMKRIGEIDKRFTIFKLLYSMFAVYIPDRVSKAYSLELRQRTNPLNLFDYNHGCDGSSLLVESIMNELSSMDILDAMTNDVDSKSDN